MENGSLRREVIRTLCSLLERENDLTRCCAAKALGKIRAQDAVPALIQYLNTDPDPDVRMEVAAALGMLAAHEAIDALIATLHYDPDGDVRLQACKALGVIRSPQSLQALMACLTADDPLGLGDWDAGDEIEFGASWQIQHEALELLGHIGDTHAVGAIIHLLQDDAYEDLQELGLRVLASIGGDPAIGFLLRQLQNGNRLTRRRAAKALTYTHAPEAVPALITALRDRNPDVRIAAAQAMAAHRAPSAMGPLMQLLSDRDAEVRREAATAIATLPGDEVTERLMSLLQDQNSVVQHQVVRVLGERQASQATPHLLTLLAAQHGDAALCGTIITALGKIRAPEAIGPLCTRLTDQQSGPETRLQAVLALGHTVKETGCCVATAESEDRAADRTEQPNPLDLLIAVVHDDDDKVGRAALLALAGIGGAKASEALLKTLQCERPEPPQTAGNTHQSTTFPTSTLAAMQAQYRDNPDTDLSERHRLMRRYAASMMNQTNDPAVVDALIHAAEDTDPGLRREALISLGHLGNPKAIPVALQRLGDAEPREVRLAALDVLRVVHTREALGPVMGILSDETDPFIVQKTIAVLGAVGDPSATPLIVQRLQDDDVHVRRAALETLTALGERSYLPAIRSCIFSRSGELRQEAVTALQKLGHTEAIRCLIDTLNNPEQEEHHWIATEALAAFYAMP